MSKEPEQVTLLIDGDTVAYTAASSCQHTVIDDQGFIQPFANVMEGEVVVDNIILGLQRDLEAHFVQVYLSDPEAHWRSEVFGNYKGDRKPESRPLLLAHLKQYLRDKYGATHMHALEADDVMGILATSPQMFPGKAIVVGKDKDFYTIPGWHYQIGNRDANGKPIIEQITREYADWFHLVQSLAGDRVDGYPGCPGIGMTRAKQILKDPQILVPERGSITRGKNKGRETTKWVAHPANGNLWGCVVSHYEKAGLSEKEALQTARLAHILRAEDYDLKTGNITLWVPPASVSMPRGER
jgi:5'-3' exonuclease